MGFGARMILQFKGSLVAGVRAVLLSAVLGCLALPGAAAARQADPAPAVAEEAGARAAGAVDDPEPARLGDSGAIVVTGTMSPVTLERLGHSLTLIDAAAIERSRVAYLADLLRTVPGVSVNRSGSFGAPTQVRIRGGEGNHTLVLIDGVEVSAIGEGEFDFASLLAGQIERVEVLRGPQSGLYGSNALAGVVSIVTKGAEGAPFAGAVEAGSFGTVLARGSATVKEGADFLSLSGAFRSTDGISTAAIGSEADGDRNLTFYLRGARTLAPAVRLDGSLRLVDRSTQADGFDFLGGPNQGLAIDDDSFADTRDVSAALALLADPAPGWVARASAAYTRQSFTGGADGAAGFGNEGRRLKFAGRLTRSFATGAAAAHALTLFAEYERETYRNTYPFDPSQVPAQRRALTGVGAQYRLDLFDAVFLSGSIRHDDNSRFADATTWSLAGAWLAAPRTRLHASWGRGVTNPTFFQQFGFSPDTFVGNPDLRPESAIGFDVGIEQRLGDTLLVDLTYFRSTLEDEIVSRFPSVANDAGESERQGIEFAVNAEIGAFRLNGAYTWLDATDPDGTREVRRPEHQASLTASTDFGPQRRATVELGLLYNGRMLDDDFRDYFTNGFMSEKTPLDAYFLVRLAASLRLTDRIALFGRVENLLDSDYQEVISYGTPGLAAYGGLTVALE